MNQSKSKLGFNATWSMAVGGMVGGGIFSTLGVVIGIAGAWAWLSFAAAGLIALAAGYSYVKLAIHYGEGGGAFTFLREINADGFAGSLSWVLIVGYVLTNAVYAFTFGQYLGHVVGLGPWFPRFAGIAIVALFIGLNLRGVGEAGGVEVFLVWFKLIVLVGLAGWGLAHWDPPMLSQGVPDAGIGAALFGAASVFMAYEGFQLLTYDYMDIETPQKTLPRAVLSAINATLFATARLAEKVAEDGELPAAMEHKNAEGIPDRAVIVLGVAAAVLAAVGTLTTLVEAASLTFLFTFVVVCGLAFYQDAGARVITGFGVLAGATASVALIVRLIATNPLGLVFLGMLVLVAFFGRPVILRHVKTENHLR